MKDQMTYFSILVTSVVLISWAIICWRMIVPLKVRRLTKVLLAGTLLLGLVMHQITRMYVREGLPVELPAFVRWGGYLSFGFVFLVMPFLIAKEILQLWGRKIIAPKGSVNGARRAFLHNAGNAIVMATALPITAFAVEEAFQTPVVKKNPLPISGLHPDLDGITIAQVSDLHVGSILDKTWVDSIMQQVQGLHADMIVLTGDAIDGQVSRVGKELASLETLTAPLGKFFVTGNHEFYSGVEPWVEQMRALDFTVLNNEHTLVQKGNGVMLMAGVWDYHGARFGTKYTSDPFAAKADAPEHDVSILLAHNPRNIYQAAQAKYDVQLSGHTHGGQYFPWTYAIHLFQEYVAGSYTVENSLLYVNTGTGFWGPPMRFTVPPEITLHTLKRV